MSRQSVVLALGVAALLALCFPAPLHAWTPGTHIYLGEAVLGNLGLLPGAVADLLRAFPFDFLYGNIAADSSIAKKYAPVGRHCHAWHVGQEIFTISHDYADRRIRLHGLTLPTSLADIPDVTVVRLAIRRSVGGCRVRSGASVRRG